MPRYPLAFVLYMMCVCIAVGLLARAAAAASPYVIDGIALGAALQGAGDYQCVASEQFPEYTWCRRERQEKGRRRPFASRNSVLHDRGGNIVYVSREIRPAFFAGNDVQAEIKRLSAKFGARPRETRLSDQENIKTAVVALWGSLQLEQLEGKSLEALQSGEPSEQGLLVDHLGDVRQSLRLGLPIYRLDGGPGYLWLATSERSGRGYLRFLAVDVAALATGKDIALPVPTKDVAALAPKKDPVSLTREGDGVALAAADLRPFLTPQSTLAAADDAGRLTVSRSRNASQQSIVQKTRADPERARLMDAERMAAEEKEKARLAWARFEVEKAAYETSERVKWTIVGSLFILLTILALLRIIARREEQPIAQIS
jgi:hypothetical protein